jgi:hypothetical protein
MNWNDYEAVWRRQQLPQGADANLTSLRETFETKSRKMAATLFVRDVAEASAGVFVAVVLSFFKLKQGKVGWWPIFGAVALLLGVTVFFISERVRTRRMKLGSEAPLLAKVDADIAELKHQRRLLLGLWKWYLRPCVAAIFIVIATIMFNAPAWALTGHLIFLAGFVPMMGILLWFAWHINQQACRKQLEPRLAELEKLRSDLLAP